MDFGTFSVERTRPFAPTSMFVRWFGFENIQISTSDPGAKPVASRRKTSPRRTSSSPSDVNGIIDPSGLTPARVTVKPPAVNTSWLFTRVVVALATLPPMVEAPIADGVFTSDGATSGFSAAIVVVVVVVTTGFLTDFATKGTVVVVAMGLCATDGATVVVVVVVVVVVTAATFIWPCGVAAT